MTATERSASLPTVPSPRGVPGPSALAAGPGTRASEPLLEVRGLKVDYGIGPAAIRAVIGADLTLHRG